MREDETRLNIKISPELLQQLKLIAKRKQLSVSALTRLLILDLVEKEKDETKRDYYCD